MQTKFEIIETPDYILAVSDEVLRDVRPYKGKYHLEDETTINIFPNYLTDLFACKLIVGYQPKHKHAPKFNLPLLPEIVVEDDVEKLAENLYPIPFPNKFSNMNQEAYKERAAFIEGHKSVAKIYSEEDLRKAFQAGDNYRYYENGGFRSIPSDVLDEDAYIQALKKPKILKWFVAELERKLVLNLGIEVFNPNTHVYVDELKTTKINGKTYLVGTYKYE
jgi:hypothetical protein